MPVKKYSNALTDTMHLQRDCHTEYNTSVGILEATLPKVLGGVVILGWWPMLLLCHFCRFGGVDLSIFIITHKIHPPLQFKG